MSAKYARKVRKRLQSVLDPPLPGPPPQPSAQPPHQPAKLPASPAEPAVLTNGTTQPCAQPLHQPAKISASQAEPAALSNGATQPCNGRREVQRTVADHLTPALKAALLPRPRPSFLADLLPRAKPPKADSDAGAAARRAPDPSRQQQPVQQQPVQQQQQATPRHSTPYLPLLTQPPAVARHPWRQQQQPQQLQLQPQVHHQQQQQWQRQGAALIQQTLTGAETPAPVAYLSEAALLQPASPPPRKPQLGRPLFAPTPGSPLWGSGGSSAAAASVPRLPPPPAETQWMLPAPSPRLAPEAGVWGPNVLPSTFMSPRTGLTTGDAAQAGVWSPSVSKPMAPSSGLALNGVAQAGFWALGSTASSGGAGPGAAAQFGGWPPAGSGFMASSNGLNTSAAAFRPSFDGVSAGGGRHTAGDSREASGLAALPASLYEDHSLATSRQGSGSTCVEGGGGGGSQAEARLVHSFGGSSADGFASSPLGSSSVRHAYDHQGASGAQEGPASCASDEQHNDMILPVDVISSLFDDDPKPGGSAAPRVRPRVGLRTDAFGAFGSQGFGLQGGMQHADWGHTSLVGNVLV